jgi:pimeloyl-ACP methyl ester carboxylesterase
VKASTDWLTASSVAFPPSVERTGTAHLRNYAAQYCVWGDGPPLVVVPGLAGGLALLGPLVRELAREYQVIACHLRGEDDAFALRRSFDLSDLVDDLGEFLDWYGLECPPVLGVSFGGVVALGLAARRPYRMQALITQGVGPRFESGLLGRTAGAVLSGYPLPEDNAFVNQFFNLFFGTKQKPGPLFDFVTQQCWQTDQGIMAHRFGLVEKLDQTELLPRIRIPSLIMAGERDLFVSARGLCEMAESVKGSRTVRLPGAGHLAFVTHPTQVAGEALAFLETLR